MKKETHQMMALLTSLSLKGEKIVKKGNVRESTFRNYFKYWFLNEYLKERDDEEDLLWQKKNEVLPEIDIIDRMIQTLRESFVIGIEANKFLSEKRAVELNLKESDKDNWFPTNPFYIDNPELANDKCVFDQLDYIFENIDPFLLELTPKDLTMQLQFIHWIKENVLVEQAEIDNKLIEVLPTYKKWIQEMEKQLEEKKGKAVETSCLKDLVFNENIKQTDFIENFLGVLNEEKFIDKNEYKKLKMALYNYFNGVGSDSSIIRIKKGSKGKFAFQLYKLFQDSMDSTHDEIYNYMEFLKSKINLFSDYKLTGDLYKTSFFKLMTKKGRL